MLITNVRILGRKKLVDVRCRNGCIVEVAPALQLGQGESALAGEGAALLPGLHDHHIHLFALAVLHNSVECGPSAISSREDLVIVLRADPGAGWLRGVGYHESVAGELDRWQLDRMVRDRPLKIQHRSGKLWMVNSLAARLLSLDDNVSRSGVGLDISGRPNGRLFRLDGWMREQLATVDPIALPSLVATSRMLASYGVTGVTDATPQNDSIVMAAFARAVARGELLQGVRVMGGESLPDSGCAQVQRAERKVMLDENALPDWDSLLAVIHSAHGQGRGVAVHCVTPAELVLALSALRAAGSHSTDRVEHASLIPVNILPLLREVGVRVITQPGFIHERGDQYLSDVATLQHADLYRCRRLLEERIPLAGSTDAPYGKPDPWAAMSAAVHRKSRSGMPLGLEEQLSPEQAVAMFTSAAADPGGASRAVAVGAPADLCLLNRPWQEARQRLSSADVRATIRSGKLIYHEKHAVDNGGQDAYAAA